jgi:hypothetical protein
VTAFGTISAPYSLSAHIINRTQFSLLVTVVVLSAIVPTVIAQRWSAPVPAPRDRRHVAPPEPSELIVGATPPSSRVRRSGSSTERDGPARHCSARIAHRS